ncbi:hypothetical protein [Floccifex sp.]|uniref:hypothetical protein n=1 Tax=Floccifex sp. TaxID=2815810 RepID=UPI003F0D63F4
MLLVLLFVICNGLLLYYFEKRRKQKMIVYSFLQKLDTSLEIHARYIELEEDILNEYIDCIYDIYTFYILYKDSFSIYSESMKNIYNLVIDLKEDPSESYLLVNTIRDEIMEIRNKVKMDFMR